MFFNLFNDTQKQMQDLLLETRSYVGLQKKAIIVETRDKLSFVLSRLAIAVVCLLLGGMALVFFLFFLAYIIGQAFDNDALGFACVSAFVLLLLLLFWFKRKAWVISPITNMMTGVFTADEQSLTSEEVGAQLQESKTRLSENFNQLVNPDDQQNGNKISKASNWISRGFAIYEGVRMGMTVVRTLNSIFGRKRRRRR